jgi:hypothetical protein
VIGLAVFTRGRDLKEYKEIAPYRTMSLTPEIIWRVTVNVRKSVTKSTIEWRKLEICPRIQDINGSDDHETQLTSVFH